MPFETPELSIADRVEVLNTSYIHHAAIPVLRQALIDPLVGNTALVSSFGAESVVLLHMISMLKPDLPVIFLDTEMLFEETLAYQREVAGKLGLRDVRVITPDAVALKERDPFDRLHLARADACCSLRKSEPLARALDGFDAWITGRKRFQSGARASLPLFENENDKRIKINPLAHWRKEDLQDYIVNNNLPRHPLVANGYPSIGCAPESCTAPAGESGSDRSGRWAGQDKEECGIHFDDLALVSEGEVSEGDVSEGENP